MEKETKKVYKRGIIKRVAIAAYCIAVCLITCHVLFHVYKPGQNSVNALCSVCMDVICILILMVLVGSFAFGKYEITRTSKLFLALLLATVWALFFDFLNWAYDGSLSFDDITYWFTIGSLCTGAVLGCLFIQYIYSYMEETHDMGRMRTVARICAILNVISFFVTFTLALTKTAFDFKDGHYVTGALYDIVTAVPVFSLLCLIVYTVIYIKKIGAHDVCVAAGYLIFMICGALIEGEYSIGTTYVAVSIADIFIFVMLQNEIIALEKKNVEKWIQKSNTDELTGTFSRHAYEEKMQSLENGVMADDLVYASIDVNGLKSINDSLGHTVGDELIIGASECLKKCICTYGQLYRIGGDEFAAIFRADAAQLESIKKEIDSVTLEWSQIHDVKLAVSCGFVAVRETKNVTIGQIAVLADKRMYDAKSQYYKQNGIERRQSV